MTIARQWIWVSWLCTYRHMWTCCSVAMKVIDHPKFMSRVVGYGAVLDEQSIKHGMEIRSADGALPGSLPWKLLASNAPGSKAIHIHRIHSYDDQSARCTSSIESSRQIIQLFMTRRTAVSYIHGHKLIILPKLTAEWAEFSTPPALASQIDGFRKRVRKVGVPTILSCDERRANVRPCRVYSFG